MTQERNDASYARVKAAVAPMHAEPRVSSPQISQQVAGHWVELIAGEAEWWLARGSDRYEGWVHAGYLHLDARAPEPRPITAALVSLGCTTRLANGSSRALPLGALLEADERVASGEVVEYARLADRFPATRDAIAESAQQFFQGTSYQWGGVTPWGADCSGFVQTLFALHGIHLPRDAWQQARCGSPGPVDPLAAGVADMLCFSDRPDGKITHVGVALSTRRLAHVALGRGGHTVERLTDLTDPYVAKVLSRFVTSRRLC